jgi:TRAP-type C4-dicarboxylate transport system permease small subunit
MVLSLFLIGIMNESPLLEWLTVFGYVGLAAFVTWQVMTRSEKR